MQTSRLLPVLGRSLLASSRSRFPAVPPTAAMASIMSSRGVHSRLPINFGIMFVPQQESWVVERMGKYHSVLEPGLNFLIPILDRIKYVQSLKEIAIEIPQQSAITVDNVALQLDGVLYLRVIDPYKASYGVEDPEFAITQLAQTTMRSEVGKITLDTIFRERETLNCEIVEAINKASDAWGITCMRYEIRDMKMPTRIQEAMQMQVEAERKKRAAILQSEGQREAEINVAEGHKRATVLAAEGEASAILAKAEARSRAIKTVADALADKQGSNAASLGVAEQYVTAFGRLAKNTNTVLLPADVSNPASMIAQALSVYRSISQPQTPRPSSSYGAGAIDSDEDLPDESSTFDYSPRQIGGASALADHLPNLDAPFEVPHVSSSIPSSSSTSSGVGGRPPRPKDGNRQNRK